MLCSVTNYNIANCSCVDHRNGLTEFYQNIKHACFDSSDKCIPKTENCENQSGVKICACVI